MKDWNFCLNLTPESVKKIKQSIKKKLPAETTTHEHLFSAVLHHQKTQQPTTYN